MQTPLGTLFLSLKCYGNTSENISANPVPREQVDTEYVDESQDKYTNTPLCMGVGGWDGGRLFKA